MKTLLIILRGLVSMGQSAMMLGGCAGLFVGNGGLLGLCLVWFLILTGVQILLYAAAVLLIKREVASYDVEESS